MSPDRSEREAILDANRKVHAALVVSGAYNESPHFRAENQAKVRSVLQRITADLDFPEKNMLDMGCGTGFIIQLAVDLVDRIEGVDITDEMLAKVDLSSGKVNVRNCQAERTPFEDESFCLVTAYSFLDHLEDYRPVIREAHRVLHKGGFFYSDLNPNIHFASLMVSLEGLSQCSLPGIVSREILGTLHNGEYYENQFGISRETLEHAEPLKSHDGGLDPDEVVDFAKIVGFSLADFEYDWYLGQAVMIHDREPGQANVVDDYLRMVLPATRGLYKYLRFTFRK